MTQRNKRTERWQWEQKIQNLRLKCGILYSIDYQPFQTRLLSVDVNFHHSNIHSSNSHSPTQHRHPNEPRLHICLQKPLSLTIVLIWGKASIDNACMTNLLTPLKYQNETDGAKFSSAVVRSSTANCKNLGINSSSGSGRISKVWRRQKHLWCLRAMEAIQAEARRGTMRVPSWGSS